MNPTSLEKNWKVVSIGLIYKDNQILIGLRYPKNDQTNLWEFPGGSVELGELPQEAMIREMKEELDITVEKSELANCLCDYKEGQPYTLIFYHILQWSGIIKKTCHQEIKWISLSEYKKKKLPNMNPLLFDHIYSMLTKKINL